MTGVQTCALPISSVIVVPPVIADGQGKGIYLFKVYEEETRAPEGRQLDSIKAKAFSDWYAAKKGSTTITRDPSIVGTAS